MIIKGFNIKDLALEYFVGINQIRIPLETLLNQINKPNEEERLNHFFNIVNKIQMKYENSVIQFINDMYILSQNHIFTACYYFLKAFQQNINISNKKNIEFLLYLATKRQISKSIEAFGLNYSQLIQGKLTLCIISPINNIKRIFDDLLLILNAEETKLTINHQSETKFALIKEFFKINDNQINSVLRSYGIHINRPENNLKYLYLALYDIICERMALLNVEKQK